MSSCSSRALTILSTVFGACGLLLVGVAVSTDYWLIMVEGIILQQNQSMEVKMALHSGLWRVCFVAGRKNSLQKHVQIFCFSCRRCTLAYILRHTDSTSMKCCYAVCVCFCSHCDRKKHSKRCEKAQWRGKRATRIQAVIYYEHYQVSRTAETHMLFFSPHFCLGFVSSCITDFDPKSKLWHLFYFLCYLSGSENGRCVASEYFTEPDIEITTENTANILSE